MFVEKWWISDKLSEWAGNHIFNRSTTLTHAHSQITPNSDFWNAMPLILPISGWSLFHLHLTSFSRVENENARLNSDLSSANLRWISNRSRQSLLRGLMKKNIADSAQIEYCITFHCSSVRPCVRHRRDISTYLNHMCLNHISSPAFPP